MHAKEKWLLGSLTAIAFLGFALAFSVSLDRYSTKQVTTTASR